MTVPVKVIHSGQTSSPRCSGTIGDLIGLLDACLVTGFNSHSVTSIAVVGNIGTATTSSDHGYLMDDVVAFEGAVEPVFNDSFEVTGVPSNTTFTFSVTVADGSATGTIASKIAPLGWTKPFTGTNIAVFRPSEGNRHFLHVADTFALYSTVNMYENMTDVSTGSGLVGPVYWKKSNAANTTTRNWMVIGTTKSLYLCIAGGISYPTQHGINFFGDIISYKVNDIYHTALMGDYNTTTYTYPSQYNHFNLLRSTSNTGQFLIRNYLSMASTNFWKNSMSFQFGVGLSFAYPSLVNNGLHLVPIQIVESTGNNLRGLFPGLFATLENIGTVFNTNDRTVVINGTQYVALQVNATGTTAGGCFFSLGEWY